MVKQEWKEKGYVDEPVDKSIDLKKEIRRMCDGLTGYYTGALLHGGRNTGYSRLCGRLARSGTQGRRNKSQGNGDVRRALHGRNMQVALARKNGAVPRPHRGLLAGRLL